MSDPCQSPCVDFCSVGEPQAAHLLLIIYCYQMLEECLSAGSVATLLRCDLRTSELEPCSLQGSMPFCLIILVLSYWLNPQYFLGEWLHTY